MPNPQRKFIAAWAEIHKDELLANWELAMSEQPLYNARPLLDKAIYAQLKSLTFFLSAKAECGTVVWNDDIDIAPEHLYECSQSLGGVLRA